jgi:hypothetical protein
MPASSKLLNKAIQLSKAGNKRDARLLLRAITQQEPGNERAWLWYIDTLTSDRERTAAIERWLRTNPGNQRAQQALNRLRARQERRQRDARASSVDAVEAQPQQPASRTLRSPLDTACVVVAVALLCILGGTAYLAVNNPLVDRYNRLRDEHDVLVRTHDDLVRDHALSLDQRHALEREHDRLSIEHSALSDQHNTLTQEHLGLATDYDALSGQYADLAQEHEALVTDFDTLSSQHNTLIRNYGRLETDYGTLSSQHAGLNQRHNALVLEFNDLARTYDGLVNEHNALKSQSITPPYIYVHDRTVSIAFVKQDNSNVMWQVPFESLEYDITRGHESRQRVRDDKFPILQLKTDAGKTFEVTDHREFVDRSVFTTVMADLYRHAGSDYAFIREVWHIVAQLTSYSKEIQDTPRYPLETLLAGGGDCEDTAILFASMILAAPVDWQVSLVYMDIHNPTAPVEMNHVIVYVDTGQRPYRVETASKHDMEPYDRIVGWPKQID